MLWLKKDRWPGERKGMVVSSTFVRDRVYKLTAHPPSCMQLRSVSSPPFRFPCFLYISDLLCFSPVFSSSVLFCSEAEKLRMTNQNVVISGEKSSISVTITVSLSKTNTYSVDSMRASSPTRVKSTATSLSKIDEHSSWITRHPSALNMFKQIINASEGKQIIMFLDYDGTLSPIVEDPDRAFMTDEMREAVSDTAKCFPTAIVTGRCYDKVYSFVKLAGLYYAGSHGMDIKGPPKSQKYKNSNNQPALCQPANEFLPMIEEVYKTLEEKTKSIPGVKIENNKFCLSVHFRCVDEKRWGALVELVRSVLNEYPKLEPTLGRKVLEIRPTIKWDKGRALEFLLEVLGYANSKDVVPVYIGDDRTDEDAFKVLRDRGQGFGILVSKVPKETNASYSLQEPAEVKDFLQRLVKWKRSSHRARTMG